MKITIIHGQNHKGSTYHIARMTAEKIGGNIEEFFLPKDFNDNCMGCYACLDKGREFCPHSERLEVIFNSMLSSDVIIIGSPTYVMEMTGQLKSFFDHLFTTWLSHRPEEAMFTKTAVVISTAAGAGMKSVTKSLAKQMFYLGIPKVYKISERVAAISWDMVKDKKKKQIKVKIEKIAQKIIDGNGRTVPGIKLKFMFSIMRMMQKGNDWAPVDKKHWEDKKWLEKDRPWKNRDS